MSIILWTGYFIESQGYNITHNKLMQDNNSSILLENNIKLTRSKHTKHMKNWYLFVMDRAAQGDLEIEQYHVERMWADILTKPIQGIEFREFIE